MREEILADVDAVARRAAAVIAESAREAVAARGRFLFATSGGSTPKLMLRHLSDVDVPWERVALFQVDERIAPAGHTDRNLTHLERDFIARIPTPLAGFYPMPVEMPDAAKAARSYAETIASLAGNPPVVDLVHLGMGEDGHTASLLPDDPVLDVSDAFVAITREYAGRRRMTMTYPVLNAARQLLWVVTGASKAAVLGRLRRGDHAIPAARVRSDRALILSDAAANPGLER